MPKCNVLYAGLTAACLAISVRESSAQVIESVGVRAQGLAGAFVAVADDATAGWWNPAGLATGAYVSSVVEKGRTTEPAVPSASGPASETATGTFAAAFPALGVSYYRLRLSEIAPSGSTAPGSADRQDTRTNGSRVRSAQVNQFGVTVGQSIGRRLVVGSTLKLLRGGAVAALAPGSSPLTEANDLAVPVHTRADLDVGGMLNLGRVRFGLTARNLTQPSFGDTGTEQLTLTRQARAGVAVFTVPHGFMEGLIVAADADLLTTPTPLGDVRHAAGGVEWWLVKGRLGGRGGASVNTVGAPRPSYSVGVSGAPTRAFHVNASWTTGQDATVAGWSAGVSVVY